MTGRNLTRNDLSTTSLFAQRFKRSQVRHGSLWRRKQCATREVTGFRAGLRAVVRTLGFQILLIQNATAVRTHVTPFVQQFALDFDRSVVADELHETSRAADRVK